MPLLLSGCLARTAVDIVTLPVKAVGAGVDAVTTSQAEADQRRGREIREEEERLGREARRRERDGAAPSASDEAEEDAEPGTPSRDKQILRRLRYRPADGGARTSSELPERPRPRRTPSLRRLFVRDFLRHDDEQEESAARERVRALDPLPAFLLGVHPICAAAILIALAPAAMPAWPARARPARRPADRSIVALVGLVPPASGFELRAPCRDPRRGDLRARRQRLVVRGRFAAGAGTAAIRRCSLSPSPAACSPCRSAFLTFPALAALGSIACVGGALFLWGNPKAPPAAVLLALCACRLSLRRSADRVAQLAAASAIDWNAQRAGRFIEEFEQAGRGWFWETTGRGALSYVSEQLAADLKTPAAELIGRPFTDLIGFDDGSSVRASERTLGFHLSARLPFTDVTVRANTSAEIWWSLSGTPSFDEYGRFLGFRGIGTDLTEQRRSEEEINRLAKYDALTGLPNRDADAAHARRGAAEQERRTGRLRLVPDRSRPLQERQRHARPPDRRRAAQAGRPAADLGDRRARPGRPARRRRIRGRAARPGRRCEPRRASPTG